MLENLYKLGTDLLLHGRRLHVFFIQYNNIQCNVIFHRLKKAKRYYTIQLEFIKVLNNQSISCYANKKTTDLRFDQFCEFFNINIDYGNACVRDIFVSFYEAFNVQVPTCISSMDDRQRDIMNNYISEHSSADEAAKKYLYDFRLTKGSRSQYNNDKAAALYPEIYEHFKDDSEHSFFFSPNEDDEVTLNQLLAKLRSRS